MTLSNRQSQFAMMVRLAPHIYEVRDENGNRFRHCGSQKDADYHVMHNPGYTWEIVYLDPPPSVVDIDYTTADDLRLAQQSILPETQQDPLKL